MTGNAKLHVNAKHEKAGNQFHQKFFDKIPQKDKKVKNVNKY